MITIDYCSQILQRLNEWLVDRDLHLTEENVLFVREDAVDHSTRPYQVQRECLVTAERFDEELGMLLAGGPSWIHSNAVPLDAGRFLVTIVAGQKVGSSRPSMNTSYDPNNPIEIISA